MTTAMSLLNIMSFFHLVDDFVDLNQIPKSAVNSISEQMNLFKHQISNLYILNVTECIVYMFWAMTL